jgi:hypothetical protein
MMLVSEAENNLPSTSRVRCTGQLETLSDRCRRVGGLIGSNVAIFVERDLEYFQHATDPGIDDVH